MPATADVRSGASNSTPTKRRIASDRTAHHVERRLRSVVLDLGAAAVEPHGADGRARGAGDGDRDRADRLGRRAAAGTRDAGDAHAYGRLHTPADAFGHRDGHWL